MEMLEEIREKALEAIAQDKYGSNDLAYVSFALYLLDRNIESESAYILAGLEKEQASVKRRYFQKVLEELQIELGQDENFNQTYIKSIARNVIAGKLDPLSALEMLKKLFSQGSCDPYIMRFIELSDAIELLDDGYTLIKGINKENMHLYVKQVFESFLKY